MILGRGKGENCQYDFPSREEVISFARLSASRAGFLQNSVTNESDKISKSILNLSISFSNIWFLNLEKAINCYFDGMKSRYSAGQLEVIKILSDKFFSELIISVFNHTDIYFSFSFLNSFISLVSNVSMYQKLTYMVYRHQD